MGHITCRDVCKRGRLLEQVVPPDATFEDYLELSVAEDRSIEVPIGDPR